MVYTKPFTIARNALGCVETLLKRGDTLRTYTLASLLAATLLAGCSSTNLIDAPSAPTNAPPADAAGSSDSAGQKAFVFESGTVPIGDFDPFTLAPDDYFDPCNDITEDEFRRAGFTGEIKRSTEGELDAPPGISACMFKDDRTNWVIGLANVDANRKMTEEIRTISSSYSSNDLPSLYVYNNGDLVTASNPCVAQLDTVNGGIGVFVQTPNDGDGFEILCPAAVEKLEALYLNNKK